MPSSVETVPPASRASPAARWNARIHYYLGLYFLFFIWLFAVTGLLLNHGRWGMGDYERTRTVTKSEHRVSVPNSGTLLTDAQDFMRQLGLEGELQWLSTLPDASRFNFRITRPGTQTDVKIDLNQATAVVERMKVNAVATAHTLHMFTGVRLNDTRNQRDWIVTTVWAYAMDAIALGLLAMVATGIWIWLQAKAPRWPGVLALGAGVLGCAWFVWGVARFGN